MRRLSEVTHDIMDIRLSFVQIAGRIGSNNLTFVDRDRGDPGRMRPVRLARAGCCGGVGSGSTSERSGQADGADEDGQRHRRGEVAEIDAEGQERDDGGDQRRHRPESRDRRDEQLDEQRGRAGFGETTRPASTTGGGLSAALAITGRVSTRQGSQVGTSQRSGRSRSDSSSPVCSGVCPTCGGSVPSPSAATPNEKRAAAVTAITRTHWRCTRPDGRPPPTNVLRTDTSSRSNRAAASLPGRSA